MILEQDQLESQSIDALIEKRFHLVVIGYAIIGLNSLLCCQHRCSWRFPEADLDYTPQTLSSEEVLHNVTPMIPVPVQLR